MTSKRQALPGSGAALPKEASLLSQTIQHGPVSHKQKVRLIAVIFFIAGALSEWIFVIGLISGFILALLVTSAVAEAIYSKSKTKGESATSAAIWAASWLVGGGLMNAASGNFPPP